MLAPSGEAPCPRPAHPWTMQWVWYDLVRAGFRRIAFGSALGGRDLFRAVFGRGIFRAIRWARYISRDIWAWPSFFLRSISRDVGLLRVIFGLGLFRVVVFGRHWLALYFGAVWCARCLGVTAVWN